MAAAEVRVFGDLEALHQGAATWLAERVGEAVAARGRCRLVLAGGTTPRGLYERLAEDPLRARVPWAGLELLFGDERSVPPGDPASNYGMVRDALLDHVPIPEESVHRIQGELDPAEAARRYDTLLRTVGDGATPAFDVVLLGMGADGHTASLFPGSPALAETRRLVVPVRAPGGLGERVTLTLPALEAGRAIAFLVAGAAKAEALARVLEGGEGAADLPAARVRPRDGRLLFFVDRLATIRR